jgi:predicted phosphate transport protein (TIGR00153 family)
MKMKLSKDIRLFRRTVALEGEIDEFLDLLSEAGLLFKLGIETYLNEEGSENFEEKLHQVNKIESSADKLRRSIETQLYAQTLIPDARGDVLGLLENLDNITNKIEGTLWAFSIEKPLIPNQHKEDFIQLITFVVEAVEAVTQASRAFFRNIDAVGDHNHKVMFYEKEADKISTKLKRSVFSSDIDLAHKTHLRHFVENIDSVADWAEDVADRLTIYVIKRTI